jgi:mRNA-degrading endonuclease toxin of MazEF toxin-antitoxin module
MTSTTTYSDGQLVVVSVVFSDQTGAKRRPALVVSAKRFHHRLRDLIVCPVTSQPQYFNRPGPGDHPLRRWESVGLRYPSTARLSKLLAVDKKIILRILGRISAEDLRRVKAGLREAFGLP